MGFFPKYDDKTLDGDKYNKDNDKTLDGDKNSRKFVGLDRQNISWVPEILL